jgi:hypothetical protein
MKVGSILVLITLISPSLLFAQQTGKRLIYAGAAGGLATLSGDGSADVTPSAASTSLLDPKNGPAGEVFAGIHLFKYVSFQADYVWNRNNVFLVSTSSDSGASDYFREPESVTQNAFLANVLVYFRNRKSRVRPYLSEGVGAVLIHSRLTGGGIVTGSPALPPASADHASIALRTLVGIDVRLQGRWSFRYTFGETLTRNALGSQVSPALQRVPKNFRSLFGVFVDF